MGLKGKKKERKEKSKVKLKVKQTKTLLPKGQNVTDTSFKVKKIVIREQLKTANFDEPLTRRKLNVKELLTRLQHHNVTVRQDGLDGLKELTTVYETDVFLPHLSALIEGITALILDRETTIRQDALKLIRSILKQVSSDQIAPFFSMLQSYLGCAMTHIHSGTQTDSLTLLDALLESTPALVAANSRRLLPNFLEMISKLRTESATARTLTVDLGSKMTSVKWRVKVLARLHGLLAALVAHRAQAQGGASESPTYRWNPDKHLQVGVHRRAAASCGTADSGEETSGEELKNYIGVLMPLLFETWLEVAPSAADKDERPDNLLNEDSAELLQSILDIIQLSWEYLQACEQDSKLPLTAWFKTEYEPEVRRYLLRGFPYVCAVSTARVGKKRKRHQSIDDDDHAATQACVAQNLALCHVVCCLHDRAELSLCRKIVKYVTKCVERSQHLSAAESDQLCLVLRVVLTARSKSWAARQISVDQLLTAALRSVDSVNRHLADAVFQLLCDLVLEPQLAHLQQCKGFCDWWTKLPDVLCAPEVPLKSVLVLTRLACQNNRLFLDSFTGKLPAILGNLSTLVVVGAESEAEGRYKVADLLYWVCDTPNFPSTLKEATVDWDQQLCSYVDQVFALK